MFSRHPYMHIPIRFGHFLLLLCLMLIWLLVWPEDSKVGGKLFLVLPHHHLTWREFALGRRDVIAEGFVGNHLPQHTTTTQSASCWERGPQEWGCVVAPGWRGRGGEREGGGERRAREGRKPMTHSCWGGRVGLRRADFEGFCVGLVIAVLKWTRPSLKNQTKSFW